MNSIEALREFVEKYKTSYSHSYMDDTTGLEIHQSDNVDLMLSDLTALISEHYYPKEFLLWVGAECPYDYYPSHKIWIHDMDRKTTDELFNYWRENEG